MVGSVKSISAILFMIGALMIIGAGVGTWMLIVVEFATRTGPGFACVVVVVTAYLVHAYWDVVSAPWKLWLSAWDDFDRRL